MPDDQAWCIDAHNFTDENKLFLIEQYNHIKEILIQGNNMELTLLTKIMLGIFASVPAYDTYFTSSFRAIFKGYCGFRVFNKKSLQSIHQFYLANQCKIDEISIHTINFVSGEKTDLVYTNSKIIDMYGFTRGC